jgi:MoxR-like ATPase
VILTSNRTRELHDALKRRCLYHWIGFPSPQRELDIVTTRIPGVAEAIARRVVAAVNRLRDMELAKPPGVAETLDWVAALDAVGAADLDHDTATDTLGAVLKDRDDLEAVAGSLADVLDHA